MTQVPLRSRHIVSLVWSAVGHGIRHGLSNLHWGFSCEQHKPCSSNPNEATAADALVLILDDKYTIRTSYKLFKKNIPLPYFRLDNFIIWVRLAVDWRGCVPLTHSLTKKRLYYLYLKYNSSYCYNFSIYQKTPLPISWKVFRLPTEGLCCYFVLQRAGRLCSVWKTTLGALFTL